jgi:hypothetical protein
VVGAGRQIAALAGVAQRITIAIASDQEGLTNRSLADVGEGETIAVSVPPSLWCEAAAEQAPGAARLR